MKKRVKIIIFTVSIPLILILLFIGFLQTSTAKNIVKKIIVNKLNQLLVNEVKFNIENIDGNFISNLEIKNVKLSRENKKIVSVRKITIDYNLGKILAKKITINKFLIDDIDFKLQQNEEQNWNFENLFVIDSSETTKIKTEKSFKWDIALEDFSINNTNVNIDTDLKNGFIPNQIRNLNISLKAHISEKKSKLNLNKFSFQTLNPNFKIQNIELEAYQKNQKMVLDTLLIKSNLNTIAASGSFNMQTNKPEKLYLNCNSFQLAEFAKFLSNIPINEFPVIDLNAVYKNKFARLSLDIQQGQQAIYLLGSLHSIFTNPEYQLELILKKIDLNHWIENKNLSSNLNAKIIINGSGFKPETLKSDFELEVYNSSFQDLKLENISVKGFKKDSQLNFMTEVKSNFAYLNLDSKIEKLFSTINYKVNGKLSKLNVKPIIKKKEFNSDIDLFFAIEGSNIKPEIMNTKIEINADKSQFAGIDINNFSTRINYDSQNYTISDFNLNSEIANVLLSGSGNINDNNELQYEVIMNDLNSLKQVLKIDTIEANGFIKGQIHDKLDNFSNETNIELKNIKFNKISANNIDGSIELNLKNNEINTNTDINLSDLNLANHNINNIFIKAQGNKKNLHSTIKAKSDSLQLNLKTVLHADSTIVVELPEMDISYGDMKLKSENKKTKLIISNNKYIADSLIFRNNDGLVKINGFINPQSKQNLDLDIDGIDLSQINNFNLLDKKIGGLLFLKTNIKGTFEKPSFNTELNLQKFSYEELILDSINFITNYSDNNLNLRSNLVKNSQEKLTFSANLPANISMPMSQNVINNEEKIEVDVFTDNLELNDLTAFIPVIDKIEGSLKIDLQLRNTLKAPEINGYFNLRDGQLQLDKYGINYPHFEMDTEFTKDKVILDNLKIKSEKGQLNVEGDVSLVNNFENPVEQFSFLIKANNFLAANSRDLTLNTDMNIELKGTDRKAYYSGNLKVSEARVNLDALTGGRQEVLKLSEPLLVKAQKKLVADSLSEKAEVKKNDSKQSNVFSEDIEFLDNLRGKLKINIPKNSWINNENMNIELGGNLEIVKENKDFEIFGYVKIIRGKYKLYGRKFDFNEGRVTFDGGTKINPLLDLSISYTFRDINRFKRDLSVNLSERAKQPKIEFYLDEEKIPESDAISYLLFGKSNEEMSQSERSEVSEQSRGNQLKSLIANQIGGKLISNIGERLYLDEIEFSGGDDWREATIIVGKYITEDLFLSYEKKFEIGQTNEIVPDKIAMEYEINPHFFLEATRGKEKETGVDLFWKFKLK